MRHLVSRYVCHLVVWSLSVCGAVVGSTHAQQVPVPLTEYMGRQIAQTMHYEAHCG